LPAFLANRLARERPGEVEALIDGASRLSRAHQEGDAKRVRSLQEDVTSAVRDLVRDAAAVADGPVSDAVLQRLSTTLRAAAATPSTAGLLRRGVLPDEVAPAGFDTLAGVELQPTPPAARPSVRDRAASSRRPTKAQAARLARTARLEEERAEARDALRQAEKAAAAAERDADRARKRVATLDAELERLRSSGARSSG
jgi:hypothetical protein